MRQKMTCKLRMVYLLSFPEIYSFFTLWEKFGGIFLKQLLHCYYLHLNYCYIYTYTSSSCSSSLVAVSSSPVAVQTSVSRLLLMLCLSVTMAYVK